MDQYQPLMETTNDGNNQWVKLASRQVRLGFVRKVYSILTAQLFLTVLIAAPFQSMSLPWLMQHQFLVVFSGAASVAMLCATACVPQMMRQFPVNYAFLFAFTCFEAIIVGFISATYTAGSVLICAAATVMIFAGLTVYAWTTNEDFTGMGPYLFGALLSLVAFGFMISIFGMCGIHIPHAYTLYSLVGLVIFVFYIIFDTQRMIGEYNGHKVQFGIDEYVPAALQLYLDIINLFLNLLQLMGNRK